MLKIKLEVTIRIKPPNIFYFIILLWWPALAEFLGQVMVPGPAINQANSSKLII